MAIDLSLAPYYDDFNEDKGFHKLLFRPGRAVQARELTQLQTILQNQIARFGQNIFLEGTVVIPGGLTIDTNYEYVKLQSGTLSEIQAGAEITGGVSGLKAILLQAVAAENSDPDTLYVRYTDGGAGNGGRFQAGETLTFQNPAVADGGNNGTGSFVAAASNPTGVGTKINLDKGVYFVKGFFVVATTQSLIIEKYGVPTGTLEVGLVSSEEIVTSGDDTSLLSNASGSSNANAPGADRYKLALTLTKKADVDLSTDDYFTVATVKDGVIVEALTRTQYAILGDELARRTYDESGNYTVKPFYVRAEESDTANSLDFIADPGRAYVKGYEVSKTTSTTITQGIADDTDTTNNSQTPVTLGNYVRTAVPSGTGANLPDISEFEQVSLRDSDGTVRGTARVRSVTKESGTVYRFYLFEVTMNVGYGFNQVRDLYARSGAFLAQVVDAAGSVLSSDSATLHDTGTNSLIFALPRQRVRELTDHTIRVQRHVTFTTNASGEFTLETGSANETWANTANWIFVKNSDGSIVTPSSIVLGSPADDCVITMPDASALAYTGIVQVSKNTPTTRPKTLATVTDSVITPAGDNSVALGQHDIFELVAVKDVDNSDADITARYTLDNGQRDNFYDLGKLNLKPSATAPTGDVKVTFKHFTAAAGDFFTVDSYDNLVADPSYSYADIPSYTKNDGSKYFLADVYDFRPYINDAQTGYTGTGAVVNEVPLANDTLQSDIEYYLPRIDILYVAADGEFGFSQGIPSLNPTVPTVPANAMPIYQVLFNAGTFDEDDVAMFFIDNKRYTMRDIGRIEERVARVEEWSTLSLLESETASLEVLSADGSTNRFKSGFFVDNFEDHLFADFESDQYRASIDPRQGELRPSFAETNARMAYQSATAVDGDASANVTVKGDFLFMSYTEEVEISQPQASSAVNVNPYAVITGTGMITLSPETDEWRDVESTTRTVAQTETTRVSPEQNNNFNNWQWNWGGFTETAPQQVATFGQGGGGARTDLTLGANILRRR